VRVLFLSTAYPPSGTGGIASYVWNLAHLLQARGHDVHVLACTRNGPDVDEDDDGVIVHRRPEVRLPGLATVLRNDHLAARVRTALSARRDVRRLGLRPDVIEYPDWGAEGLLLPRRPGVRVAQIHGPLHLILRYSGDHVRWTDRLAIALERRSVRRADIVVVPSAHLADELADWLPGSRIELCPHPIAPPASAELLVAAAFTEPRVVCVTRLQRIKGVDVLVDAMAIVRHQCPDAVLRVVAGPGSIASVRRDLEAHAAAADVALTIVGPLSLDELPDEYNRARVVVVPSRFETFSMTAMEAMVRGRPVVVTDNTGVAPVIAEFGGGTVVPVDDPAALAAALAPFLLDPDEASRAGARAAEVAQEVLAGPGAVDRRLELYGVR
jgi:glycosyltransferase involved in cell wall biosynthesis